MRASLLMVIVGCAVCCSAALGQDVPCAFRDGQLRAVDAWLGENLDGLVSTCKHIHANPELSLHEEKTAALVAKALRDAGYDVTERVGGYGVVGVLVNGDGPTVLVRGDMDALPVVEQSGLDYASKV